MLKLKCAVQSYAWGKHGSNSIVGRIARKNSHEVAEESKSFEETPFAEYWMGDHANGPSKFNVSPENCAWLNEPDFIQANQGNTICLSELISLNPATYLGSGYSERFPYAGNGLAFLFKVLSVQTALSIQAHPDRSTAQRLHAEQPSIYKDPNPKPEVAIALTDDFAALFGFATPDLLAANFSQSPTLQSIVAECTENKHQECQAESAEWLKDMVFGLFNRLDGNQERLAQVIAGLKQESEAVPADQRSLHQKFCLILNEQYGNDVGVVFSFLMNIVTLEKGQWFLIDAGVPHCYIQGELMECMINSDNVVRGGLTPKLKDKTTLCEILPYEARDAPKVCTAKVIEQEADTVIFQY